PYTGTFRPEPGAITATVTAAGSGYKVNDILNVLGGVFSTRAQLKVTSVNGTGGVTGVSIITAGAYITEPINSVSVADVTTPAANGAAFKLTYGGLSVLNGKNYQGTWILRIKDGVTNG